MIRFLPFKNSLIFMAVIVRNALTVCTKTMINLKNAFTEY